MLIKMKFAIYLPAMNEYICFIYYGLYFTSCYYISIHYRLIYKYLFLFIAIFSIGYITPINNGLSDSVTFINVGQGDCCLITHKYTSVLIDTGGSIYTDIGKDCLIPYFKSRRIYDIDLVITTHDDYDHMGALSSLKANFTVGDYIKEADKFPIDINGLHFINYNTFSNLFNEENDKSLVIGFKLFNTDFLIMGDAPIKVEKEMIKNYKSIDIICLDSSSSESKDHWWKPKTSLIQVKTSVENIITTGFTLEEALDKDYLWKMVKGPYVFVSAKKDKETDAYSFRYFIIPRSLFVALLYNSNYYYVKDMHKDDGLVLSAPAGIRVSWLEGNKEFSPRNKTPFDNPIKEKCEDEWKNIWMD